MVLPILICPDDRFPQGTSSASSAMIKEKKKNYFICNICKLDLVLLHICDFRVLMQNKYIRLQIYCDFSVRIQILQLQVLKTFATIIPSYLPVPLTMSDAAFPSIRRTVTNQFNSLKHKVKSIQSLPSCQFVSNALDLKPGHVCGSTNTCSLNVVLCAIQ